MLESLIFFWAIAVAIAAYAAPTPPLAPLPNQCEVTDERFSLNAAARICYDSELRSEALMLADALHACTGVDPKLVVNEPGVPPDCEIRLALDAGLGVKAEGYSFESSGKGIAIEGKDPAGVFYGVQTLLQLLPPPGGKNWGTNRTATVPGLKILDEPRFAWRGMMLDVGRHFYDVKDIKQFLDLMAFHKLNTFHWHLTEDQGWRLEIKKYPKLTEVGAWRDGTPPYGDRKTSDGKRYGGFYTQEQVREIVAYAARRHITVVPEIEMPGHAAAAIAAYPQLGNDDISGYAPRVAVRWGVHPYIYAPKEETFAFLDGVLDEVCSLFPSKYIHIGGDEAPKDQWKQSPVAQQVIKREGLKDEQELQSWFIRRIEKILAAKGRRLIGWDEIQEGGLPKTATMMVWRNEKWAKHALGLGNDVVMAPNSHTYFDHYQAEKKQELAKGAEYESIGGFLPIEKVYSYDPGAVAADAEEAKHILGVQAQLWSEYFKTWDKVTYHTFPRMAALAEVAWTRTDRKNYADFRARLDSITAHYDAEGIKHGEVSK